ncbi:hypothetical protein ACWENO_22320, partial [Streptomyces sp. NPDC004436]
LALPQVQGAGEQGPGQGAVPGGAGDRPRAFRAERVRLRQERFPVASALVRRAVARCTVDTREQGWHSSAGRLVAATGTGLNPRWDETVARFADMALLVSDGRDGAGPAESGAASQDVPSA